MKTAKKEKKLFQLTVERKITDLHSWDVMDKRILGGKTSFTEIEENFM